MAQRRMFSKGITNSSSFLTMPHSCQLLYFHLGMNADDDGYCEHVMVSRMGAFQPDDLKILCAKGFVHVFNDMVLVILDWKENNYIQKDRYTPSKYLEKHALECVDTKCIQDVDALDTQVRLGKVSIGKDKEETSADADYAFSIVSKHKDFEPKSSAPGGGTVVKKKKHKYGEYGNVLLSTEEYENLKSKWGNARLLDMIRELDEGIQLKGYKYKDHNLAIQKWEKRSEKSGQVKKVTEYETLSLHG